MIATRQFGIDHEPAILPFRRAEDDQINPDEPLTLRTFYERFFLPETESGYAPNTLKEKRTAIKHWSSKTGDPDIRVAGKDHLIRLRDKLAAECKRPATINKVWRELKPIFEYAREEGYIQRVPRIAWRMKCRLVKEPPKIQRETIMDDEVCRLWEACKHATYPVDTPIPAPRLWRRVLLLLYVYGPRPSDVFPLGWGNVRWRDRLLAFEAMKTSKLQGLPLIPIVEKRLREIKGHTLRIFHGFNTRGCYLSKPGVWKPGYYATWNREILPASGIEPRITFKNFRETMVTRLNGIEPGLGAWAAAHYVPGVTAANYDLPTQRIREAFEARDLPACFLSSD